DHVHARGRPLCLAMCVWRRCLGRPGGDGDPRIAGNQRGKGTPAVPVTARYWTVVVESERMHSWRRFTTLRPHGNGRELWSWAGTKLIHWRPKVSSIAPTGIWLSGWPIASSGECMDSYCFMFR